MRGKSRKSKRNTFGPNSFNEARALCAGSHPPSGRQWDHDAASMRPAHYAREVGPRPADGPHAACASMRPAHYAREVSACAGGRRHHHGASMRPAHYAREVERPLCANAAEPVASMRPAHYAREVVLESGGVGAAGATASMRPAHYAREVSILDHRQSDHTNGFNEARALCAGSPKNDCGGDAPHTCFNEARALCAGSHDDA